jgi:NAD(P)-dependent dehydrogenase (short-subunit alcohol dehydrogenase family)
LSAGKTVFITGCSVGIGRATAELFHRNGWRVVATMLDPAAGGDLAKLGDVLVEKLDVTDERSIRSAVTAAIERFGGIDVLVNNAGYGAYGVLEATSVESMRKQFETNVIGLLAVTGAVLPEFRKRRGGVIVNVSSIGGRVTLPFSTLYSGSKFAVEGISEALSYEMREIGVRVKVVEPGMIKTNFFNAMEFSNDRTLTEYQRLVGKLFAFVSATAAKGADAAVAAEAIYTAATDGTDQLRYTAGEDARLWASQRASQDDAAFFAGMRALFGQ